VVNVLLSVINHLHSLFPFFLESLFCLFNFFPLNADPLFNLLLSLLIGSRRHLILAQKFVDQLPFLAFSEYEALLLKLYQFVVLIVLHDLRKSLLRELLKRVPVKQRARGLADYVTVFLSRRYIDVWLVRGGRALAWLFYAQYDFWWLRCCYRVDTRKLAGTVRGSVIVVRCELLSFVGFYAKKSELLYVSYLSTCSFSLSRAFNCIKNGIGVLLLVY